MPDVDDTDQEMNTVGKTARLVTNGRFIDIINSFIRFFYH